MRIFVFRNIYLNIMTCTSRILPQQIYSTFYEAKPLTSTLNKNMAALFNHMYNLWPQTSEQTPGTHGYSRLQFSSKITVISTAPRWRFRSRGPRKHREEEVWLEGCLNVNRTSSTFKHWHSVQNSIQFQSVLLCVCPNRCVNEIIRITPCNVIEKLVDQQLIKKFPPIYGTHSQEPASNSYPEPNQFYRCVPITFLLDPFFIWSSH